MRERRRLTGRLRPGQLLLVVVALAAVACGYAGTSGSSPSPSAQAAQPSPTASAAVPHRTLAATTPPEPTAAVAAVTADTTSTVRAAAPVRLRIPAIGVDSDLMALGLQADGTLEVPPTGFPAGWYTGAPTPGELGPAIIAGHVDWGGQPGVFFDLRDLASEDEITVVREDGSTVRFRVDRVEHFAKDQFPTERVYADLDHAGLRLITCGGDFDRQAHSYEDNLVVFARLVEADPDVRDQDVR